MTIYPDLWKELYLAAKPFAGWDMDSHSYGYGDAGAHRRLKRACDAVRNDLDGLQKLACVERERDSMKGELIEVAKILGSTDPENSARVIGGVVALANSADSKLKSVGKLQEKINEQAELIDKLRAALVSCGRSAGGSVSDHASADFLLKVPDEVSKTIDIIRNHVQGARSERATYYELSEKFRLQANEAQEALVACGLIAYRNVRHSLDTLMKGEYAKYSNNDHVQSVVQAVRREIKCLDRIRELEAQTKSDVESKHLRDELASKKATILALAEALGYVYEAEGQNTAPAPTDALVAQIHKLRGLVDDSANYRADGAKVQRREWVTIADCAPAENCDAEAERIAESMNRAGI